jgi:hypothetical protein
VRKTRLFVVAAGVLVLGLSAATATWAGATSTGSLLELKLEGKPLAAGAEVLLVAGYSLGDCYWEEQEFKVTVNRSGTDRLARAGQPQQLQGCTGGPKSVEITSAGKMTVRMAPMRIHLGGPCVYEFREMSAAFAQKEWGPEIYGSVAGKLYAAESAHAPACAKTRTTVYDIALSGVETRLVG